MHAIVFYKNLKSLGNDGAGRINKNEAQKRSGQRWTNHATL